MRTRILFLAVVAMASMMLSACVKDDSSPAVPTAPSVLLTPSGVDIDRGQVVVIQIGDKSQLIWYNADAEKLAGNPAPDGSTHDPGVPGNTFWDFQGGVIKAYVSQTKIHVWLGDLSQKLTIRSLSQEELITHSLAK